MEITEQLATFAVDSSFETLSNQVVTAARRAVLDTVGVTLAGVEEEGSRILLGALPSIEGPGTARVLGTRLRTTPPQAALANGALGHALDFDDVSIAMRGHPSVPVLPAVLATAECLEVGGAELLTAFAVGFEVECRLGRALGPSSYERGWHATSILGAIGAAAACARLRGLDVRDVRHAFGIAASMASGSRQNFGTMTKPLHAGLAARAGFEAAELAARGFTAAPDVLEAPLGFGELFSPEADWRPERLGDPGKPWQIVEPGIGVKKYPCCYMTHQALDAVLAATRAQPLEATEVDRIEIRVPAGSTSALIHSRPESGLEGKFSMEYCTAAAVMDGELRLRTFDDEQVLRPAAQELLRRVEVVSLPVPGSREHPPTSASVYLRRGAVRSAEVEITRGDPRDPLCWDELAAKYRDCAGRVLSDEQSARSLDLIARLPETPVDELLLALCARGQPEEGGRR